MSDRPGLRMLSLCAGQRAEHRSPASWQASPATPLAVPGGIVPAGVAPDLEKNRLHHLIGIGAVSNDAKDQVVHKLDVAVVELLRGRWAGPAPCHGPGRPLAATSIPSADPAGPRSPWPGSRTHAPARGCFVTRASYAVRSLRLIMSPEHLSKQATRREATTSARPHLLVARSKQGPSVGRRGAMAPLPWASRETLEPAHVRLRSPRGWSRCRRPPGSSRRAPSSCGRRRGRNRSGSHTARAGHRLPAGSGGPRAVPRTCRSWSRRRSPGTAPARAATPRGRSPWPR